MTGKIKKMHWSSAQVIITGFLFLILAGTVLLMLPVSSAEGRWTSFTDALFTSTSASCVTGLVVKDTATYWSGFGQFIIILLIQTGGMGVVTMALAISLLSGRRISLSQRQFMQDSISARQVGGIVRMTGFILRTSLCIELLGAFALSLVFIPEFGIPKGIWYSLFHGVSAFCNAGFDLMGVKSNFSSLVDYTGNGIINITVTALILTGGLGFATWADIRQYGMKIRRYSMQSKIILVTTAMLVIFPMIYFYYYEFSQDRWAYLTEAEKLWASFFRAITPRTAGFNTVDMTAFSEHSLLVTIVLMLIGGCPGSTAGGMKTTTIAVLFLSMSATFMRKGNPDRFGRRIGNETIKNAATIFMMYTVLFVTGSMAISMAEGLPLSVCMFETASAIGTVGLSLGLTPTLGMFSRTILILLMYLGRVGGLTLIFATVKGVRNGSGKYPEEKITVG